MFLRVPWCAFVVKFYSDFDLISVSLDNGFHYRVNFEPMKRRRGDFAFFDRVLFILACVVFVAAFVFTPKKKVVFRRSELVFAQWWDSEIETQGGKNSGILKKLVSQFEAENPAVRVKIQEFTKEEFKEYIFELAAAHQETGVQTDGQKPARPRFDVAALDAYWVPALIKSGFLRELEGFEEAEAEALENAEEGAAAGVKKTFSGADGLYAVPLVSLEKLLFYNIAMLSAAGYDRPPKNRDDFYSMCKKISGGGGGAAAAAPLGAGHYGSMFTDDVWTDCYPWIWQAGINVDNFTAKDGALPGGIDLEAFFKDKRVRAQTAFLQKMMSEQLLMPFPFTTGIDEKIKAFSEGKAAMVIMPVSAVRRLRSLNAGLSFNVTAVPPPPDYPGRPVLSSETWFAGIPAAGANAGNAILFLEFLASKRAALAEAAGALQYEEHPEELSQNENEKDAQDIYNKAKNISSSAQHIEDYYLFSDIDGAGAALIDEIRRKN